MARRISEEELRRMVEETEELEEIYAMDSADKEQSS